MSDDLLEEEFPDGPFGTHVWVVDGERLPYWHGRALAAEKALERIASATRGLYTGPDNRNQPELLRVKRIAGKALEAIHV